MSQIQRNLNTPGSRLKYLRATLLLTRSYIEKKYQLPEITLKSWENGTIKVSKNGVKRCIAVYKEEGLIVDEDWITCGKGIDPTVRLSVDQYLSMPSQIDKEETSDEVLMMQDANDFKKRYSGAVVMMVSGDEMSPYYQIGDYVGGKLKTVKNLHRFINRDCIVYLKDGKRYLRRIFQDSAGRYNLGCLNPSGETIVPVIFDAKIEQIAPVIWVRKKDT